MNFLLLASALAPSAILLWLFLSSDEYPEPPHVVLTTFLLGFLLGPGLLVFFAYLEPFIGGLTSTNPYIYGAGAAFLMAAVPEEIGKFLILRCYAIPHREFDEPMDGIVYGVTASLGFATMENLIYVYQGGLQTALWRAVTSLPCHAMLGAIMGYHAGRAVFSTHTRRSSYFKALLIPIALHGLFDLAPLTFRAAGKLGTPISPWAGYALSLLFLAVVRQEVVLAAKATGTLRAWQRRGRGPRFVFEGAWRPFKKAGRAAVAPAQSLERNMERLGREVLGAGNRAASARVMAVIFTSACLVCLVALVWVAATGSPGLMELFILGGLSTLFGMHAVNYLVRTEEPGSAESPNTGGRPDGE
ncbi:PrsW family intramembrane metalloprotease [Pseudodesulfovibrio cashew]|uniref:PrsW family intramembrane metalloprotease n=1 Tax=Pseudodesulfovibrio cashew TaxID=2678688 RepID=A0A6I6JAS5_9BACT|nr:PrsW family glutamic-type intramembrane protease [Pseudodesulfovibrio cashew]QGY39876.1 PrsW family intramembrane metalloprotease [Pseudodesulfovibrio cashew]